MNSKSFGADMFSFLSLFSSSFFLSNNVLFVDVCTHAMPRSGNEKAIPCRRAAWKDVLDCTCFCYADVKNMYDRARSSWTPHAVSYGYVACEVCYVVCDL